MDMKHLVSCTICMETFDKNVRPRSLPCGHTFCTGCINKGIQRGLLSCAHCKKKHRAANGRDFPINYTAETLISGIQAAQLGANSKSDNDKPSKLQRLSESVMRNLKRGQVFAVQGNGSHSRSGRISISNGKTYLHCLRDCRPPSDAITIPYDEVIEILNKDSVVAFMDLSWEGSIKGRIQILLSPQTPLATQFWYLCTAHLGPSYLHTTFLYVNYCRLGYSGVIGGDYENGDGSGGAPLFSGLNNNSDIYIRDFKPGSVGTVDFENDGPKSAQFEIYTATAWTEFKGIFGQVQDGLDLMRQTYTVTGKGKNIRIEDCGIVLPFEQYLPTHSN